MQDIACIRQGEVSNGRAKKLTILPVIKHLLILAAVISLIAGSASAQLAPLPNSTPKIDSAEKVTTYLTGTVWLWLDNKDRQETIKFLPNGKAQWSIRPGLSASWSVSTDGKRVEGVGAKGQKFKIVFDDTYTKGRLTEAGSPSRSTNLMGTK